MSWRSQPTMSSTEWVLTPPTSAQVSSNSSDHQVDLRLAAKYCEVCKPSSGDREDRAQLASYFAAVRWHFLLAMEDGHGELFVRVLQSLWPLETKRVQPNPNQPHEWFEAIKKKVTYQLTERRWIDELSVDRVTLQTVNDKRTFYNHRQAIEKLTRQGRFQLDFRQFARILQLMYRDIDSIDRGIRSSAWNITEEIKACATDADADYQNFVAFNEALHRIEKELTSPLEAVLKRNLRHAEEYADQNTRRRNRQASC
ncbi:hypothetical protein DICA3_F08636 [Diutina catenulata]